MPFPRLLRALLVLGAALALSGCTPEMKVLGPFGPPAIPSSGFARAAFLAEVNVASGRIRVSAPDGGMASAAGARHGPDLSLLGGDAALLTTSNFSASAVGAFQPGKVRVSFDIAITNRLAGVILVGPTTFPAPPPGSAGPLLFPYDVAIAVTAGGTSSGGSGNDVIVVLPGRGLVAPSPEWDGAPWNFFNDSTCVGADDCFPYEEFAAIAPGTPTLVQRVGFDIDPTVGQFTARLLLAADLADLAPPPVGTVQGSVSSPLLGPLAGVTVSAQPGGFSAVTDAAGGFTLPGLPVGTVLLTLTGLPPACAFQPSYAVVVFPGTVTSFPLSLTCAAPPLFGDIAGTVTDGAGSPLAGVALTFTPNGGAAMAPVTTGTGGGYVATGISVADGTGLVTLAALPLGCIDPGPLPYAGLVNGGTLRLDLVVSCP